MVEKAKTPAKGPIPGDPPRAQTQKEVQDSWDKAKNFPVAIASKRDPL
jgi:hypothetical protein